MYVTQKEPYTLKRSYMWCPSGFNPGSITFFLNSIMFAVETNIFYPNSIIKELFENVNKELANVTNWCVTNKLSINASKISS